MKTVSHVEHVTTILIELVALGLKESARVALVWLACLTTICGVSHAATFFDDFEAPALDPFWSTSANNASIGFSTTQVHGGTQSLQLTTLGVAANKGAQVSHALPSPVYGTASVWVYDSAADELSGNYIEFYVYNSILGQRCALYTQDYDLGPSNGGIYYYDAFTVPSTATTIDRTKNWHLFEIESLSDSMKLSIDGATVFSAAAGTPFDRIVMEIHAPGFRPGLSVQYDDIQLDLAVVLEADGNGDGWVDGVDYLLWAGNFGDDPADDPPGSPANGDYNDDGRVDGLDYLVWASNFGNHAFNSAVPEPGALALLMSAAAICAVVRRHR